MKKIQKKQTAIFLSILMMLVNTLVFTPKVYGSTNDDLVAYYTFDGNTSDSSPGGNNGTAIGDIAYVSGINGQAASFNGKSYIEVPSSSSLNLTKNFSVSVWLYKNTDSSDNTTPILVKTEDTIVHQAPYRVYDRLLKPYLELGHTTGAEVFYARKPVDMHAWKLVTFTYDGQELKYYIDGVLTDTKQYNRNLNVSSGKLLIGKMDFSGKTWFYNGFMDDLRLYNRTLSYDDVKALYSDIVNGTGKDIVNKPPMQMAYFKFNGNLDDSSGNKNNATVIGNEKYEYAVQGKGFVFDAETYLEVPDSDSLEATSGFTFSTWMKVNTKNVTGVDWPLLDRPQSSITDYQSSYTWYTRIFGGGKSGQSCLYLLNEATSPTGHLSNNIDSKIGNWCMLTVTYDDSTKTLTYYVNGSQIDVFNNAMLTLRHSGGKLIIGLMNKNRFFKGTMDELRLYNYPLNINEIKKLYAYRDTLKIVNNQTSLNALKAKGKLNIKVLAISPDPNEAALDVTKEVSYSSLNQKVFKVSSTGAVTGVGKGTSKITVSNGVNSTAAQIKVK